MELESVRVDLYKEHDKDEVVWVVLDTSDHILEASSSNRSWIALDHLVVGAFEDSTDANCFIKGAEGARDAFYEVEDLPYEEREKKMDSAKQEFLSANIKLNSYEYGWYWGVEKFDY